MPRWMGAALVLSMAGALAGCGGALVEVERVVQPFEARPAGLGAPEGVAMVRCRVGPGRRPEACMILSATPDTPDIRELALAGAVRYDLSDPRLPQPPVGASISFPVRVQIR